MARMANVQDELTSTAPPPEAYEDPEAEAAWLYSVGQKGDLAEVRALIAVPAEVKRDLLTFARLHPHEARWVNRCLAHREAVLAAFDRMAGPIPTPAPVVIRPTLRDLPKEELPTPYDLEAEAAFRQELTALERFRPRLALWD